MKISRPSPWILSSLLVVLLSPLPAHLEEEKGPKIKIQKLSASEAAQPSQTQTVPEGKDKTHPASLPAGVRNIEGTVSQLIPARHAILIRTNMNAYQVFATPQSVLVLDGQPTTLEKIQPNDRVDLCYFNGKNVIQKLVVTSAAKARYQISTPAKQP